jgi:phage portal protein BeeE
MTWGRLAAAITPDVPPSPSGVTRQPARAVSRPNHLAAITADDFWGAGSDMVPPTRSEAMSVPAMARARHIITLPARLPITITPGDYRATALIEQPDPTRTRMAVLAATIDDLLFDGVSLWRVTQRYARVGALLGRPRHAEHIIPDRRTYDPEHKRWLIDDKPVADVDLVWFEGPHTGVLSFGGRALRSAVALERAYRKTAENPAAAWELHQTSDDELTDPEIDDLVDGAAAAVRKRGVLYTNSATQLNMHEASSENLLISGRTAAAIDVARMTGLPSPVLDAYAEGSSANYANVQARLKEARDIGVDAYAAAITARLSLDDVLPRGVACSFDWDALLRNDFADRMAGYKAAQEAGVYDVDECRAIERGPIPESRSDDA